MILLEELLDGLDVRVEAFALCHVPPGGTLNLGRVQAPTVHYSLTGSGTIRSGAGQRLPFKRHSFVILPAERSMTIAADGAAAGDPPPQGTCEPLSQGWPKRADHDEPATMLLTCGRISATYRQAAGLFDHLPEPLVDDFACEDGVCRPFETLLAELADPRPGTHAIANALMQQCLALLLRRYCASGECRLPWLSALEDPRLNRVLQAMLSTPEQDFSLESLADLAGMSRSAFAAHFAEAFGRSPIEFLKETRLRRAAQLLRSTDLPVKAVAPRVGYASRSYFSRAFKAYYGLDPDAFRRQPLDDAPQSA